MFDWQAIGTHAVELLIGGVGTWVFSNLRQCRRDINAAFKKIRALEMDSNPDEPTCLVDCQRKE